MAKSDKATILRRIDDVTRLVLAGAEFADIRQYASDQVWQVSQRQIRRYLEAAYKRLAQTTKRDRKQLLGRHLMQRRALYARSLKGNDVRTALQVLRDEAALQGLYPPTKITSLVGTQVLTAEASPLSRRERVVRLVAAEAKGDKAEKRLIEHATPYRHYRLPDTMLPAHQLNVLAMNYVGEQLEQASMLLNAFFCTTIEGDEDGMWDFAASAAAYRFRIGREGWQQFTRGIGVDGDYLVRMNHSGFCLTAFGDKICNLAPSADELRGMLAQRGHHVEKLHTAEDVAKSYRRDFMPLVGE
jgi:hypothetical protein